MICCLFHALLNLHGAILDKTLNLSVLLTGEQHSHMGVGVCVRCVREEGPVIAHSWFGLPGHFGWMALF